MLTLICSLTLLAILLLAAGWALLTSIGMMIGVVMRAARRTNRDPDQGPADPLARKDTWR